MATNIPPRVREQVLTELIKQLDAIKWEQLTSSQTSEWYNRLVRDENIGRRLAPYMADAKIRVWIKDGPAKEYRRALEGRGSCAKYTGRTYPGPEVIVRAALGDCWELSADSVEEKPMRCRAKSGEQTQFLIWGPLTSLQGLVWQAATALAADPDTEITLVITRPSATPLEGGDWELAEKLAQVLRIECEQVTYAVKKKPTNAGN